MKKTEVQLGEDVLPELVDERSLQWEEKRRLRVWCVGRYDGERSGLGSPEKETAKELTGQT